MSVLSHSKLVFGNEGQDAKRSSLIPKLEFGNEEETEKAKFGDNDCKIKDNTKV